MVALLNPIINETPTLTLVDTGTITLEETTEFITPEQFLWRDLASSYDVDVFLPSTTSDEPHLQVLHLQKVVQRLGVRITSYVATVFDHAAGEFTSVTMRSTQQLVAVR